MIPALLVVAVFCRPAIGQEKPTRSFTLRNVSPTGVRNYITESTGTIGFGLTNHTSADQQTRMLTYYAGIPDRQYGRDLWVPAQSTLWTWFPIGAPAPKPTRNFVELKTLLYQKTGDQEHIVPSPDEQALHSNLTRFFLREASTAVMLDADLDDGTTATLSVEEEARTRDIRDLARVLRSCLFLSDRINWVTPRYLPPAVEGFEGIDHFLLASNRIADDAAGQRELRGWLQRGGFLWVPVDIVEPRTISALLGDALEFEIVDRVSLTSIPLRRGPANRSVQQEVDIELEDPVDFVRVLAPGREILHTVNGWPASMVVEVGRGRVVFTMLGARGWYRPRRTNIQDPAQPRQPSDGQSPYSNFPHLPVARDALVYLANELHSGVEKYGFSEDDLQPYVIEQIGYSVVSRGVTLLIFAAFFLALIAAAAGLSMKARLEQLGWLGPVLAIGASGLFLVLGERARSAVPPTVAAAQLIETTSGLPEMQASGLLAVYHPEASTAIIGSNAGGQVELDFAGFEGRVLRRVQTDLDAWHWENLELPAGVRVGRFRYRVPTTEPIAATLRFGPNGAEGRVSGIANRRLEDVVISTPAQLRLAVRVEPDGTFRAGSADALPPGQFVAETLLNDKQRDRQQLYAKILAAPLPRRFANRRLMLAWTDPLEVPFTLAPPSRLMGSALFTIPLQFERSPPGTAVTIPGAFLSLQRVNEEGNRLRLASESAQPANMRLRFQIPVEVLPLRIDRARFTIKLSAPSREVVVAAFKDGRPDVVRKVQSPIGVEAIDLTETRHLQLDDQGGLYVNVDIGDTPTVLGPDDKPVGVNWRIDYLDLEVHGQTEQRRQ